MKMKKDENGVIISCRNCKHSTLTPYGIDVLCKKKPIEDFDYKYGTALSYKEVDINLIEECLSEKYFEPSFEIKFKVKVVDLIDIFKKSWRSLLSSQVIPSTVFMVIGSLLPLTFTLPMLVSAILLVVIFEVDIEK